MADVTTEVAVPRALRVRHELRRRTLTVLRVQQPAEQMARVILGGPELTGFTSLGFDDHVKVFFPVTGPAAWQDDAWVMRDFTPRRYDARVGELWIDFYLHEAGPAAAWAAQASAGQRLVVAGPKGSAVIEIEGIDHHVLIGDETALPAIHRRLDELPRGARALAVVEIEQGSVWPAPVSQAEVDVRWVPRDGHNGPPAHELLAALRNLPLPPERCFCWVAGESNAARAIRRYLVEERGIGKRWVKAAGYWQRGATGLHDRIDD